MATHVALVTGANKGLGLEIARQLGKQGIAVVLGTRDREKGEAAAALLRRQGIDARPVPLDVADPASIANLPAFLDREFGRLDILVNNAGVLLDRNRPPSQTSLGDLRGTFEVNFFGALVVTQAVLPLLLRSDAGRIVNMSSTLGSLADASDPSSPYSGPLHLAYRSSKTALNMLTVTLARELRDTNIKVNSVCPGWVQTDMGSPKAPLNVAEGADTPVWAATLPADGPSGTFFRERKPLNW